MSRNGVPRVLGPEISRHAAVLRDGREALNLIEPRLRGKLGASESGKSFRTWWIVARGIWSEPGVAPAEVVGRRPECFEFVMKHLAERGVSLFHRVVTLD